MYFKKLLLSTFFSLGILYGESSVGLDINDKEIELFTAIDLNVLGGYSDSTKYYFDASYLRSETSDILYRNNITESMGTVGVSAKNTFQNSEDISVTVGIKSIFADNFLAFPFFGKAIFTLPLGGNIPPTSLSALFAYAPEVLSFNDALNYKEFRAEANMEVIPNIHLFGGYRNIDTNYQLYDKNFNESFYGGMKFSF